MCLFFPSDRTISMQSSSDHVAFSTHILNLESVFGALGRIQRVLCGLDGGHD